jgi:4-hydroxy-3-methylbut-2-en-1-yl diphosphate synthase IspG/GcpE
MGCAVNGPGEAREARIMGSQEMGNNEGLLFAKGEIIQRKFRKTS